ncbi:MAG TPA: hypothetical protein VHB79_22330 [Polyangiaceae bacterium]|nr:hypothetical protein [Polyangiaceae bacterium]
MSPTARAGRGLALASVCLWTAAAAAEPSEEAVRFQYAAPAECPDAASFSARVRLRTARGREAAPGELARTFIVNVGAQGSGFVGAIEFLDDAGVRVSRRLGGEQCESVVDSLALITALALDATLREEEPATTSADATEPRSEPELEPESQPAKLAPIAALSPPAPRPRERWLRSARLGVLGSYETTLAASPFGLLGQLDWRSGWALRLDGHFASSELTLDDGRRAKLRQLGLEASVCHSVFERDDFVLSPCAWLDVGSLRAEGQKSEQLTHTGAKTIMWVSVGPELRAAWEPQLPLWVELRATLGFPLNSYTFVFERPDATVYDVPTITAALGAAAGVRFW